MNISSIAPAISRTLEETTAKTVKTHEHVPKSSNAKKTKCILYAHDEHEQSICVDTILHMFIQLLYTFRLLSLFRSLSACAMEQHCLADSAGWLGPVDKPLVHNTTADGHTVYFFMSASFNVQIVDVWIRFCAALSTFTRMNGILTHNPQLFVAYSFASLILLAGWPFVLNHWSGCRKHWQHEHHFLGSKKSIENRDAALNYAGVVGWRLCDAISDSLRNHTD